MIGCFFSGQGGGGGGGVMGKAGATVGMTVTLLKPFISNFFCLYDASYMFRNIMITDITRFPTKIDEIRPSELIRMGGMGWNGSKLV